MNLSSREASPQDLSLFIQNKNPEFELINDNYFINYK
jgi:hypothetical protein